MPDQKLRWEKAGYPSWGVLNYRLHCVYIENIQIHPSYQGCGYARLLLTVVCDEALKRGVTKFAIHARTENSFNAKVKKVFEKSIHLTRDIEKWRWANGEPCQYIEWEYMPANGMNKT